MQDCSFSSRRSTWCAVPWWCYRPPTPGSPPCNRRSSQTSTRCRWRPARSRCVSTRWKQWIRSSFARTL